MARAVCQPVSYVVSYAGKARRRRIRQGGLNRSRCRLHCASAGDHPMQQTQVSIGQQILHWLRRTPAQTFILCPLAVLAWGGQKHH